jgi:hypothetical protein
VKWYWLFLTGVSLVLAAVSALQGDWFWFALLFAFSLYDGYMAARAWCPSGGTIPDYVPKGYEPPVEMPDETWIDRHARDCVICKQLKDDPND